MRLHKLMKEVFFVTCNVTFGTKCSVSCGLPRFELIQNERCHRSLAFSFASLIAKIKRLYKPLHSTQILSDAAQWNAQRHTTRYHLACCLTYERNEKLRAKRHLSMDKRAFRFGEKSSAESEQHCWMRRRHKMKGQWIKRSKPQENYIAVTRPG